MQNKKQVYAVDAHLFSANNQENVVILIYSQNVEIAKNRIPVYQQQQQIRLRYTMQPLPLELYFQRHGDERFIKPIKNAAEKLSEDNPLIIFCADGYLENDKADTPCLTKKQLRLRTSDWIDTPFLFQPVPETVIPYLWKENSQSKCYVLINAEKSVWFPTRFERDDIRFACLFKGEEAEKRRKTAPYLVELPSGHPFAEELFSVAPTGKEAEDGFQQWHKNFGFFFCSSASLDALSNHFRRFIYMPTHDGRLLYFRFYDPTVLEDYFERLTFYPKKLATFWGGGLIDSFLLPKGDDFVHYEPAINLSEVPQAKKQFDKFEMDVFIEQRNQTLRGELIDEMIKIEPRLTDHYTRETIEKAVEHCYRFCNQHAIYQTIYLAIFTLISLEYGVVIDVLDPERCINEILQSNITNQKKLFLIKQRVIQLKNQGNIQSKLEKNQYD